MNNKPKIAIISAIVLLLLATGFYFKRKIYQLLTGNVWDQQTQDEIATLQPSIQKQATQFINAAQQQGIYLRINKPALRTYDQQNALYNQGRTTPGAIVTNAQGGQSFHNFGLAFDVVPVVNNVEQWNQTTEADYKKIADIAKQYGFQWGGDWTSFKDIDHFQQDFGYSLADIRNMFENGTLNSLTTTA